MTVRQLAALPIIVVVILYGIYIFLMRNSRE